MKVAIITLLTIALFTAGCQTKTTTIDITNDEGKALMALDYRDFDQATARLIQSLVQSGELKKPGGGKFVVATADIINDTMQRIDTRQLMAKVEEAMMSTGMVIMTSAVGQESDKMVTDLRDLRDSKEGEEFKGDTLASKGTLIAPDLSISGKILQRNLKYDKKTQQVEDYFQLKLTELATGLRPWQKEVLIGKRGSSKSVSW